jgi:hypothetical protein
MSDIKNGDCLTIACCDCKLTHNFLVKKAPAKLRLGIYYLRKSVFLIFLNNRLTTYYTITYCLKRKNKKRFFSFQSMPNLNFAELIIVKLKRGKTESGDRASLSLFTNLKMTDSLRNGV